MGLDAPQVAAPYHTAEAFSVFGFADHVASFGGYADEAVHEVEVCLFGQVFKERVGLFELDAVPAHVRQGVGTGLQFAHAPGYQAEPGCFSVLLACLEHQLHAEAYAQYGFAGGGVVADGVGQTAFV